MSKNKSKNKEQNFSNDPMGNVPVSTHNSGIPEEFKEAALADTNNGQKKKPRTQAEIDALPDVILPERHEPPKINVAALKRGEVESHIKALLKKTKEAIVDNKKYDLCLMELGIMAQGYTQRFKAQLPPRLEKGIKVVNRRSAALMMRKMIPEIMIMADRENKDALKHALQALLSSTRQMGGWHKVIKKFGMDERAILAKAGLTEETYTRYAMVMDSHSKRLGSAPKAGLGGS